MSVADWFAQNGFVPATFQRRTWRAYAKGEDGLLIAPTGSGKTYAVAGAVMQAALYDGTSGGGLRLLWVTPLRALASDITAALQTMSDGLGLGWQAELRMGDTSSAIKTRQRKKLPEILVTTPESLHIMLSYPDSNQLFESLHCLVVDEWHDLLPTKRGIMIQLARAHLLEQAPSMRTWAISATIGNPEAALTVLLGPVTGRPGRLIQDTRPKKIKMTTVIPQPIERFPWAGHVGDTLIDQVLGIIAGHGSTLLFTNTRKQSELWYHKLLGRDPDLAGRIALHHGSLAPAERTWVENALHEGRLKAVICTSSLDLGVDFRPVDGVIQIGDPKAIARFVQRGGRSGHAPGAVSNLYFVPTNAMELFDAAALKTAVSKRIIEPLEAPVGSLDVLVQWLVTRAVGGGFRPVDMYRQVRRTAAFYNLNQAEWDWALTFVTTGGPALNHYDHYRRLVTGPDGLVRPAGNDVSRRHRRNIGVITASTGIRVQVIRGSVVGSVDEPFAGNLKTGQVFWLGGRPLEFVRLRDTTVWVRPSKQRRGITPAWNGGRLPLSSQLADVLRQTVYETAAGRFGSPELRALQPLIKLQQTWSRVPAAGELLIEQYHDRSGYHIVVYPFEGRQMHEIIATLWAGRLSRDPNTFSYAYNDYGFELLAARPVALDIEMVRQLIDVKDLEADVSAAIVAGSLPQRQFRSIAVVAGLLTRGGPGTPQSTRHLQASSEMIYDVLREYDGDNRLLGQARREVMEQIVDLERLKRALDRLRTARLVLTRPPYPTPFAFPLIAERLRERLSSETLAERLGRLQTRLERHAE